jgi:multiple sugar transport system permease protein
VTAHSALIPVGLASVAFSLWFTGWTGWASRRLVGAWGGLFLVGGVAATAALIAAVGQVITAKPAQSARLGYLIQLPDGRAAFYFAVGAALLLLLGCLFTALVRRRRSGGHISRRTALDSWLHIALGAGVVLFGIPFAWLVVTSFKEDTDMASVPPVWIPRVQVNVEQPENSKAALVTGTYKGTAYRGAAIKEFPDGRRRIRILEPPAIRNTVFIARVGETHNVRKVGLKWENYLRAAQDLPVEAVYGAIYVFNTLLLVALNVCGTLLASSLVGYAFARLRFPGREGIFVMLLATLMLPGAVTMLPVFLIFRSLGWIDTLQPLWVPAFFGSAFNVFLLRQFFLTVPPELEEAARIDGCSHLQTFWRIMLPQVKPALAAVAIWTFTGTWNNFMGPLIYINSPEKMPVSYALQLFQSAHGGDPGALMAATTTVMLPVVLVFFFAQRYFIEGVTLTGLGGR